jgi:hypothetical protein
VLDKTLPPKKKKGDYAGEISITTPLVKTPYPLGAAQRDYPFDLKQETETLGFSKEIDELSGRRETAK